MYSSYCPIFTTLIPLLLNYKMQYTQYKAFATFIWTTVYVVHPKFIWSYGDVITIITTTTTTTY